MMDHQKSFGHFVPLWPSMGVKIIKHDTKLLKLAKKIPSLKEIGLWPSEDKPMFLFVHKTAKVSLSSSNYSHVTLSNYESN